MASYAPWFIVTKILTIDVLRYVIKIVTKHAYTRNGDEAALLFNLVYPTEVYNLFTENLGAANYSHAANHCFVEMLRTVVYLPVSDFEPRKNNIPWLRLHLF